MVTKTQINEWLTDCKGYDEEMIKNLSLNDSGEKDKEIERENYQEFRENFSGEIKAFCKN